MANRMSGITGYDAQAISNLKAQIGVQRLRSNNAYNFPQYNPYSETDYQEMVKGPNSVSHDEYADLLNNRQAYEQDPQDSFFNSNVAETPYDASPVPLTDMPTSSTNALRPRTVAAGYLPYVGTRRNPRDQQKGKMTVLFRDGTLYNYYDVSPGEWLNFKGSISKGRPWLNKKNQYQGADGLFLAKPRGPADVSLIDDSARQQIYIIARTAQVRYANFSGRKFTHTIPSELGGGTREFGGKTERKFRTETGKLATRQRTYARATKAGMKQAGLNPMRNTSAAKGGKNPNQR
jgi:hypothetical protein